VFPQQIVGRLNHQGLDGRIPISFRASQAANVRDRRARRYVRLVNRSLLTERSLQRIQYFLEISISEGKDNYYGRVHCNDEPKQNSSLSTQPLYFIAGLSETL
jgi:hypothetical protein